jgi:hypothetical protein
MRFNFTLAAVAATLAATPAVAQQATTTEPAEARGVVLQSLTLTKISDLNFGTVAGSNTVPGTVNIDADNGARTATGGVSLMPSGSSHAQFDGLGVPGQQVILTLTPPPSMVLVNGGGQTLSINSMTLDSGNATTRTIGGTGQFSVFVGGNFQIAAGQAAGLYTANFNLTADYQ